MLSAGCPFEPTDFTPNIFDDIQLGCTTCGWAVTPIDPQGDPFNPDYFAGDGRALIGQFSTADGSAIQGTMLLQYISNGVTEQSVVSFLHVPGPGVLALLGLAGLMGTRRRSNPAGRS